MQHRTAFDNASGTAFESACSELKCGLAPAYALGQRFLLCPLVAFQTSRRLCSWVFPIRSLPCCLKGGLKLLQQWHVRRCTECALSLILRFRELAHFVERVRAAGTEFAQGSLAELAWLLRSTLLLQPGCSSRNTFSPIPRFSFQFAGEFLNVEVGRGIRAKRAELRKGAAKQASCEQFGRFLDIKSNFSVQLCTRTFCYLATLLPGLKGEAPEIHFVFLIPSKIVKLSAVQTSDDFVR